MGTGRKRRVSVGQTHRGQSLEVLRPVEIGGIFLSDRASASGAITLYRSIVMLDHILPFAPARLFSGGPGWDDKGTTRMR
jgi:hypothetical protein